MREAGIEAAALVSKLARIGTSLPVEPFVSPEPLVDSFDFTTFGRAPARFDMDELTALNARIVHQLEHSAVRDRLPAGMDEEAWSVIRPNLQSVAEAADWWHIVEGPVEHRADDADRAFVAEAAAIAETVDWNDAPWKALTGALKQSSGRSGKALFLPLRQAITGRDSGPEMAPLLALIGKEQSVARLRAAAA
jgi:glutamyl-tRNA synthetase